jgi:protein associated with RNAse G/E
MFEMSFVKLVPVDTFWTACFNPVEPVVDVDIVLPVHWNGNTVEEVDLELDILCLASGEVRIRDREEFDRVQEVWAMPDPVVVQVEETCRRIQGLVELGAEPFGKVGRTWLSRFLDEVDRTRT